MSDQQTPPPKPKVGSLRDRIAAFEKPAGGSPPGPALAPRPKPGGISWKPKQPSPPSSPSSADAPPERKVGGGMSASDAKESIGKGGSLKERMAALQNRGGFGAPPPIAPKPPLEKPKWKPPPVVTPVDKDDDDEPSRSESSKSPPPTGKLSFARPAEEGVEEESAPAVEGENQAEADPEEERQRRAAIAARMARLGGARVGMAPVFGRNPAPKKPEPQEEEPSKVQAPKEDEETKDTAVASPPSDMDSEEASQPPEASPDRYPKPTRKGSESSSLLSPEVDSQQSRSPPTSMPLPSAPRRVAPPRKKAAKSPEISPPTVLAEPLAGSPEAVPTLDPIGAVDSSAVIAESDKKAVAGDVQEEVGEVDKDAEQTQVVVSSRSDEPALTGVEFSKKESAVDELFDEDDAAQDEPSIATFDEMSVEPQTEAEEGLDITAASSHSHSVLQQVSIHDHEKTEVQSKELDASDTGVSMSQVEDDGDESVVQVADESEEDEEAARRQRIAEKLAKMGGVNPFAPPPQRKPSGSSEDVQTSPTLAKRASISRDSVASPPPPPQRRQSTRQASIDSYPTLEGEATQASDPQLTKSPVARPLSRKNTSELAEITSGSLSRTKSQDDSWQVSRDTGVVSPMRIPEETERSDNEEEAPSTGEAGREGSKTDHDKVVTSVAYEETEDAGPVDDFDDNPVLPPLPPPVPNLSTRPVSVAVPLTPALPVDPAVPAEPLPVPLRSVEAVAISPARPPRLIPQPNEQEEEASGSELSYTSSHEASIPSQEPSEDEYDEPPRRLPPRSVPNEETTEDESLPLPVPNRRSSETDNHSRDSSHTTSGRPVRSIPPPPPLSASISDLEQDSDFDEALPTPPRHRPMTPGTPPTNEIPLIVPPPTSGDTLKRIEPSPLRHSSYPASEQTIVVPAPTASDEASPSHLSPPLSVSEQEILDEEEGDPIDPSFYSPSRRTSTIIAPPTSPPPAEPEEDEQAARRRTIAERMAKLGGIKFGAAPLPPSMRATSPPTREEAAPDVGEEQMAQPSEEEEERARKERIAAKLAGMGGMRIGMMPLGVGAVRPQASHVLTEETPSALPSRAVPPTRPPPPPRSQDSDAEHDSSLSTSQHSLATSDDGVKVEAEESEIEEVSYADAEQPDEELEEVPPPVPVRGPHRRGTGSETEHVSTSPPPRPPVPTGLPSRKSSVQTTASLARKSSADSSRSVQRTSYKPQSEYVMVEEPSGFAPDENVPPPRPTSRPPNRPPARGVPAPPPASVQAVPPADSISSQWELPSIPSSSLEFGGTTDLSLSWPEDSNPALSPLASPPPPPPEKSPVQQPTPVSDRQLSSDDLMAVWGRVGVQVCEAATTLFEQSKKSLVGDGTYEGFVHAVLSEVPNVTMPSSPASYGYLVYAQTGSAVQKRTSEIMPGDVLVLQDAKFKGHKGLQTYHQTVGVGEQLVGIVCEFEPKRSKVKLFQANQHVGQQTVEAVNYRLEDLKSGTVKVYRVLES